MRPEIEEHPRLPTLLRANPYQEAAVRRKCRIPKGPETVARLSTDQVGMTRMASRQGGHKLKRRRQRRSKASRTLRDGCHDNWEEVEGTLYSPHVQSSFSTTITARWVKKRFGINRKQFTEPLLDAAAGWVRCPCSRFATAPRRGALRCGLFSHPFLHRALAGIGTDKNHPPPPGDETTCFSGDGPTRSLCIRTADLRVPNG